MKIEVLIGPAKHRAVYHQGEWSTPGLAGGDKLRRELNLHFAAGHVPPYANAMKAVRDLGGEIITPPCQSGKVKKVPATGKACIWAESGLM